MMDKKDCYIIDMHFDNFIEVNNINTVTGIRSSITYGVLRDEYGLKYKTNDFYITIFKILEDDGKRLYEGEDLYKVFLDDIGINHLKTDIFSYVINNDITGIFGILDKLIINILNNDILTRYEIDKKD